MGTRGQATAPLPNPMRDNQRPPDALLAERVDRANQLTHADTLAYSIPEFCRTHGISRAHFYNLSKNGGTRCDAGWPQDTGQRRSGGRMAATDGTGSP